MKMKEKETLDEETKKERINAKKMKLVKLNGWGETIVTETRTDIRQWLL